MYTSYRLKANELNEEFLRSIKNLFQDRVIEIAVCDVDTESEDETRYLLKNPANRARLLQAIENITQRQACVELDLTEHENRI